MALVVACTGYGAISFGLLAVSQPDLLDGVISALPVRRDNLIRHGTAAVALLTVTVLGILILRLHIRRSKHARLAYCLWHGSWLLAIGGFTVFWLATAPRGFTAQPLPPLIVSLVSAMGLVYFLRARRVRKTFVRDRTVTSAGAQFPPPGRRSRLGGWLGVWTAWVVVSVVLLAVGAMDAASEVFRLHYLVNTCPCAHCACISLTPDEVALILWRFQWLERAQVIVAVLGIGVLWLHLSRSRRAPLAYCCWLPFLAVYPVYVGQARLLEGALFVFSSADNAAPLLAIIAIAAVAGLVYFQRARRVREVFVY